MENELPKRKNLRLKNFDYSSAGAYFVTVCIRDRARILSDIAKRKGTTVDRAKNLSVGAEQAPPAKATQNQIAPVGEGLAPPAKAMQNQITSVGEGLAPPEYLVRLKPCGEIVKEQLQQIETRFPTVSVEDFIIMPDHIHAVILLHSRAVGASPAPTLNDVICAFKSLTARICKARYGIEGMFQRSFAEHIIRDGEDYETRRKYIYENPMRWYYKHLDAKDL